MEEDFEEGLSYETNGVANERPNESLPQRKVNRATRLGTNAEKHVVNC